MTRTTQVHIGIGIDARFHNFLRNRQVPNSLLHRLDESVDIITIEDQFARPEGDGLDAILFANWLAARTRHAGIIAGAPLNVLEPFHVSTAIATLDYVSEGRAGLLAQSLDREQAKAARQATGSLNGYPTTEPAALARDLDEAIDVVRRLWDSWEDDAVIRDTVSQRFIDGGKLRYVDFKGSNFSVLGPSITPRPPQGQPVIAATVATAHNAALKTNSDLIFLSGDIDDIPSLLKVARAANPDLRYFADIDIGLGAAAGKTGSDWHKIAEALAARLRDWVSAGLSGVRFKPLEEERDLQPLIDHLIPALRSAGIGKPPQAGSLRERLALPIATNRYVNAA